MNSKDNLILELHEQLIEKEQKINELKEDLEYSNYCNEELRKKITNLNYKIKLLEEDNTGERALYHRVREVKEEYKDRIDKAIEEIETELHDCKIDNLDGYADAFLRDLKNILKGE